MTISAVTLRVVRDLSGERVPRDRLELLTTLIAGPSFDPVLRPDFIRFPPDHPTYAWLCVVDGCQRPSEQTSSYNHCWEHGNLWRQAKVTGMNRADFLLAAQPLAAAGYIGQVPCRICVVRPARSNDHRLCYRHREQWRQWYPRHPQATLEQWLVDQTPFQGYGDCLAAVCPDLAYTPLGLCRWHDGVYQRADRPGGLALPRLWFRYFERKGEPVPVVCVDRSAFREWCRRAPAESVSGRLNLRALHPLVAAEIKWGLFRHEDGLRAAWPAAWVQALANACRQQQITTLVDLDLSGCVHFARVVVREILNELRIVYFTVEDSREAGFIETDHFGVRFLQKTSHLSLTAIGQRWLRDLCWDTMAALLRSPKCPTRSPFDRLRRACLELGEFLALDAPEGGHDPRLLRADHLHRFVADYRHREHNGLSSLVLSRNDGKPAVVTAGTRADVFAALRRLLLDAWKQGRLDSIGLSREFAVAMPASSGPRGGKVRRPFPDHVAKALVDETNLLRLDALDIDDHGLRDVWETLVATGRRCGEVIGLRLNCLEVHNGLPLLWHDQTKIGHYDEAIRIPETIHTRLTERREKTVAKFVQRHGRHPTAEERTTLALFPSRTRNPRGTKPLDYSWFNHGFRMWADELDLGEFVAHQARHTLATTLLKHGADLSHIRRYLGHVSERMTERYAKVALSEIEDVLQHVWVAGPGSATPGALLSAGVKAMDRAQAEALAVDLSRRSTPAEGGFCTFQPVVQGHDCPWNLDCHNCDKFVLSGADLLYWRRKREQWRSIAERAPDDATADYLHQVFEPTHRAIEGLEQALAAVGLLDEALALDMRRPQDFFNRVWSTAFRAADLTTHEQRDDGAGVVSE